MRSVGVQLLQALATLHHAGVTHCDVKPANILSLNGQWCLGDIGLMSPSRDLQADRGTRGFCPPEGPDSPQADLFAVGRTLYLLWTGQPLAEFDRFARGELPGEWESALRDTILRACHPQRERRFQQAEQMLLSLRTPTWERFTTAISRRRWLQLALAGSTVAASGMAVHWWMGEPHPRVEPRDQLEVEIWRGVIGDRRPVTTFGDRFERGWQAFEEVGVPEDVRPGDTAFFRVRMFKPRFAFALSLAANGAISVGWPLDRPLNANLLTGPEGPGAVVEFSWEVPLLPPETNQTALQVFALVAAETPFVEDEIRSLPTADVVSWSEIPDRRAWLVDSRGEGGFDRQPPMPLERSLLHELAGVCCTERVEALVFPVSR